MDIRNTLRKKILTVIDCISKLDDSMINIGYDDNELARDIIEIAHNVGISNEGLTVFSNKLMEYTINNEKELNKMGSDVINYDYVISLEVICNGLPNSFMAMAFKNNKIENYLSLSSDNYKFKDFINILLYQYNKDKALFIFDSHFPYADDTYFKDNTKNNYHIDYRNIPRRLADAKNMLIDFAIDSNFDDYLKLEFTKLTKELNNLELIPDEHGNAKINRKDKNINYNRANCYLQYIDYVLTKRDVNIIMARNSP